MENDEKNGIKWMPIRQFETDQNGWIVETTGLAGWFLPPPTKDEGQYTARILDPKNVKESLTIQVNLVDKPKDRLRKATIDFLGMTEQEVEKSPAYRKWIDQIVAAIERPRVQGETQTAIEEVAIMTEGIKAYWQCSSSSCSNRRNPGAMYCNECSAEMGLGPMGVPPERTTAGGVDWGTLSSPDEPKKEEPAPDPPQEDDGPGDEEVSDDSERDATFRRLHKRMFPRVPKRDLRPEDLRVETAECPEGCFYVAHEKSMPPSDRCERHGLKLSLRTRFFGMASARPIQDHFLALQNEIERGQNHGRNWSRLFHGLEAIQKTAVRLENAACGTADRDQTQVFPTIANMVANDLLGRCKLFNASTGSDSNNAVGKGETRAIEVQSLDGEFYKPLYVAGFALDAMTRTMQPILYIESAITRGAERERCSDPMTVGTEAVWVGTDWDPFGRADLNPLILRVRNPLEVAAHLHVRVWAMRQPPKGVMG